VEHKPPLPPFDRASARQKVRGAENAWNTRDAETVSLAYTRDSIWRNRSVCFTGRDAIVKFLAEKWQNEYEYRLIKELWAFDTHRIAVRFQYEWRNTKGDWFRAHGNELWAFADNGLMARREASINDIPIAQADRLFHWPLGPRPDNHPGLSELGV